jgi:hypothetical protein
VSPEVVYLVRKLKGFSVLNVNCIRSALFTCSSLCSPKPRCKLLRHKYSLTTFKTAFSIVITFTAQFMLSQVVLRKRPLEIPGRDKQ